MDHEESKQPFSAEDYSMVRQDTLTVLNDLSKDVRQLETESKTDHDRVVKLYEAVFEGNGEPALRPRMAVLEQRMNNVERAVGSINSKMWGVLLAVAAGALSSLAAIGIEIFKIVTGK